MYQRLLTRFLLMFVFAGTTTVMTGLHAADLKLETYGGKLMPQSNSVILSSEKEVLVIDAQFLRPDAQAVISIIEATGKPLTSILITHEHPDHVWGAVEMLKRYPQAKVYAREVVITDIIMHFRARLLRWTEDFPELVPTSLMDIEALKGNSFDFDGHSIEIVDLQPNEIINSTGFYIPELKTYVAGDQVFHKTHAYIAGGLNYPEVWIDSFKGVRENYDIDVVIPGHGPVGAGDEVFDSAIEYLQSYATAYAPLKKQSIIAREMLAKYPDYALKEVLFMTTGPAVTAPDLIEMMKGHLGFAEDKH
jgi:glyoxylase-like metal-dependent hydrolase (beta-lactamase superfamily II)